MKNPGCYAGIFHLDPPHVISPAVPRSTKARRLVLGRGIIDIFANIHLITMIRLNNETPPSVLQEIKIGDLVTDTFSKTGLVESIDTKDDGYYCIYIFELVTGRTITIKR